MVEVASDILNGDGLRMEAEDHHAALLARHFEGEGERLRRVARIDDDVGARTAGQLPDRAGDIDLARVQRRRGAHLPGHLEAPGVPVGDDHLPRAAQGDPVRDQ